MSDPQDHSQSGFDPGEGSGGAPGEPGSAVAGPGGGAGGGPEGAAGADPGSEAQRFWDQYARRTRPGGHRGAREPSAEAENGDGAAAAHSHECLDWCPICRTADVLRSTASPELRSQLHGLQRDALVTLRELLDAYIERIEDGPARRQTRVEDIRIE